MTIDLSPTHVLAALGVVLAVGMVWRLSVRRARAAADAARAGARVASLAGRVITTAAVIVGVQWVVIHFPINTTVLLVALGLPALFAAHGVVRALTVTAVDRPRRHR